MMPRLQLLDRLNNMNKTFRNLNVIQKRVAIRYTAHAIVYLYPTVVNNKFNTRNMFHQIGLATKLKDLRYTKKEN